ncbi:unnamed protein product [Sphagnum jensenii]
MHIHYSFINLIDKHVVEYGLQLVQRLVGGVITTMQCLFCVHIGHEKREGPDWTSYQLLSHQEKVDSSRKRRSLAFTVSWRRTRIACSSSFRGLRSLMMWWEIYFSIRRKTKKTMHPNRSRRPTP